ncbi:toll/interleukin-1 receptor domain-containing protein [Bradyrhizobium sp. AUGA SZCCT0158]|uniref:toll/interleukin-1 receptor domain-containing protein n=1 Tax=Bradyrhizobium sp. AUGA SZCCT0158 TaxID=2807661 RepID=UPI001BA5B4A7|nr:toll/interleukin-1 receptor domain-containing protein [Bradyrhizobium sp. AUGA SZCCT0158]MBR1199536.1 toll/interleukin-1 receptor domain-containing protein [Bradyrhizobium sp. AUGA SZCCT0158]
MTYKYDIFISYKRHPETLGWIKKHFEPLLGHRVGLALGSEPTIFVHEINQQVSAGELWPQSLGDALGVSKVLVALWTKTFFNSVWCAKEMSHMLGRQGRAKGITYGLVIPAIIHDGEDFPKELKFIQSMDIRSCYNTRMREDSPKAEELSDLIDVHSVGIAKAIQQAPNWQSKWSQAASDAFFREFYKADTPAQTALPKFQPK